MSKLNKSGTVRITIQPEGKNDTLSIQRNLNHFHSSFESQLFSFQETNATDRLCYDYPFYFYYYLRTAFILCLVPFWVDFKDKTNIKLVTYKFQRVLCGILNVSFLVSTILWFRLRMAKSVRDRPDKIFDVVNYSCWAVYVLVFANAMWSIKIIDLFNQPLPSIMTRKVVTEISYNLITFYNNSMS